MSPQFLVNFFRIRLSIRHLLLVEGMNCSFESDTFTQMLNYSLYTRPWNVYEFCHLSLGWLILLWGQQVNFLTAMQFDSFMGCILISNHLIVQSIQFQQN